MNKLYKSHLFSHPFTCIVSGPSKSGKTHLVMSLLNDLPRFIDTKIEKILFCYSEFQEAFEKFEGIEFHKGVVDTDTMDAQQPKLVIIDDMMDECLDSKVVSDLFTKGSHHKNISVIFMTQNIFAKGKYSRTISLNSQYLILFKNPRDQGQIRHLAQQMYPGRFKFLVEAYNDATEKAHGYLFVDNHQATDNEIRIQTNILGTARIVYVSK